MNMEELTEEETEFDNDRPMLATGADDAISMDDEEDSYRTIGLYYMDPNDAIGAHTEFKQMDGLRDSDVRITSVSLAKALRSASNPGKGLLSGQPIDDFKGTVLPAKEGGSMRHKIMPPKKQLFYAARCYGKERVGLFSNKKAEEGEDDAMGRASQVELSIVAALGTNSLALRKLRRTAAISERRLAFKPNNQLEADYQHMDGHYGVPVFYAPGMERRKSRIKSLVSGAQRKEIPLFFDYEDLQAAWQKTKPIGTGGKYLANKPPSVEVFNLWDVLTSMEKEQDRRAQKSQLMAPHNRLLQALLHPFQNRIHNLVDSNKSSAGSGSGEENNNLLDALVFIPASDACTYKESITARGDGKARLRPMR